MHGLVLVLVFGWLVVGCTKPNPNRCCTDEADCMAVGLAVGSTCAVGLVCRGNQCIAQPCSSSSECDAAAPYCVDELCGEACTEDSQCPGFGQSGAEYCVDGACVACRTSTDCSDPMLAVCEAGGCRGCATDSECASRVCDVDTKTCMEETAIAYASPSGSSTSACTSTDPCTLSRALTVLDETRNVLKLADGTYSSNVSITSDQLVRVYGPATVPMFGIGGSGTLIARDLTAEYFNCGVGSTLVPLATMNVARSTIVIPNDLAGGAGGSFCKLTLRNVQMKNPYKTSLLDLRNNSTLTMDQTVIDGGTGIRLSQNSSAHITNSILMNVKSTVGTGTAISYDSSTNPSTVSFTTFYNAPWPCATGGLVWTSKNNIFLYEAAGAPSDTVTGNQCSHHYALIKPQSTAPTGANNILNQDPRFTNAANGDFHLVTGSPAIDAADPTATESIDYEGTARPQGTARDIGAFEYKP
jgi:hypothetical protein